MPQKRYEKKKRKTLDFEQSSHTKAQKTCLRITRETTLHKDALYLTKKHQNVFHEKCDVLVVYYKTY